MTCEQLRLQLADYSLGTLTEPDMAAVRGHLRGCGACRAEARTLDDGVAMFASVAHVQEPPPDLKRRVMGALAEEWQDPSTAPVVLAARRGLFVRWHTLAAAAAVVAIVLTVGVAGQVSAARYRGDAVSYRQFLSALGGKDVRVATLRAPDSVSFEGAAILYDSDHGQSWIMVLARAPGRSTPVTVSAETAGGKRITIPFPLKFDPEGEGWTGLVTSNDISTFTRVVLREADGTLVASGAVTES